MGTRLGQDMVLLSFPPFAFSLHHLIHQISPRCWDSLSSTALEECHC